MKKNNIRYRISYITSICALSGLFLFGACGKTEPNMRDTTGTSYGYASDDERSRTGESTSPSDTAAGYERTSNTDMEGIEDPTREAGETAERQSRGGGIEEVNAEGTEMINSEETDIATPSTRNLESTNINSTRGVLNSDGHNIQIEDTQGQDQQGQDQQEQAGQTWLEKRSLQHRDSRNEQDSRAAQPDTTSDTHTKRGKKKGGGQ